MAQLGGNTKPTRIRVLDLPFTAVEWVLPGDLATWHSAGSDSWMVWERSPLARERSLMGYWDEADDHQIAAAAQGATEGPSTGALLSVVHDSPIDALSYPRYTRYALIGASKWRCFQ